MSFLKELKRRNVIRVGVAYIVAAWLIIQVTETIFPLFGFGDTPARITVIVLAIGFPLFLLFSWVFEITPEGLMRETEVTREATTTRKAGKSLDRIIFVLLAVALGYFSFDKFVLDPARDVEIAETAAQRGAEQALEEARETTRSKSIAVLPFDNMSSDIEQEYFSDGLSDMLIHVLAQVSGLKVTAKTSSFHFKGKDADIVEIARQLNVGTILEGSVQKSGNRIRVIAQLINADDGTHYWSKNFDRDLEDIFAVQDEIAQEVVSALKVTFLDTEEERLAQRYQPALDAFEKLILGRYEMAKRTADSLAAAEQHFKQAIELDPDYALAYVGLADTYALQWTHAGLVIEESINRRGPLVDKALELDPFSGEAYTAKASLLSHRQLETQEHGQETVVEYIRKALELNPNYSPAHLRYSGILFSEGRFEEALVQVRLAAELDPMSQIIQTAVAGYTWNVGRVEEALALIQRNIERTPEFPLNYTTMAQFKAQLGKLGEAQRWIREARRRNPDNPGNWWLECIGLINLGDDLAAEDCANQFSLTQPGRLAEQVVWADLEQYRGNLRTAITSLEFLTERLPGWSAYDRWLADLLAGQGDTERARHVMANAFPGLLSDELKLVRFSDWEWGAPIVFTAILHVIGDTQQRDVLLLAMDEVISTMHRMRGRGYGIMDVYVYSIRGDRNRAIAALREATDMGWRGAGAGVWWLRDDWKLKNLHQEPDFIALVDELEADIAIQRQWYEENKDKPLF